MAALVLTVTQLVKTGSTLAAEQNGDATNGHDVANSGKTVISVRNSGAGARVVTFVTTATQDGLAVADRTKSIPAGETHFFSGFDTTVYSRTMRITVEHAELKLVAMEPAA